MWSDNITRSESFAVSGILALTIDRVVFACSNVFGHVFTVRVISAASAAMAKVGTACKYCTRAGFPARILSYYYLVCSRFKITHSPGRPPNRILGP